MKDAKGHGSEGRGGSMGRSEFASQPAQGAKFQARQSMKAANSKDSWEARYGTKMDQDRLRADAINQGVNVGFKSSLKEAGLPIGGGQPVVSDAHAAATLAGGGAKSAPVDTHPAMADSARGELAGATKNDMNPFTARMVLQATNSGDKDYHALSSSQTSDLHDYAKQFGYRKSASSPGSTSRAFHGYLHKQLTNTRGR